MRTEIETALELMQRAIDLLDSAGEIHIAAHLQSAIAAARGE